MVERLSFRFHHGIREVSSPDGPYVLHSDYAALEAECERLRGELETAHFVNRHTESMSADAIHAVRELLDSQDVPKAAFIDDHVGNAIVQRNQERARAEALEARLSEVEMDRDAFREIALEVASVSKSGADTVSFLIHLNQIAKRAAIALARGGKAE